MTRRCAFCINNLHLNFSLRSELVEGSPLLSSFSDDSRKNK